MAFRSGRTEEQGLRPFVIEGGKLYTSPRRFSLAKSELVNQSYLGEFEAERAMLRAIGFTNGEIYEFALTNHPGFHVVVDHELAP